jgi:hypothetical protein
VAFGDFSLMISTAAWKSRKETFGFSTVTTGPAASNQQNNKADISFATETGHFYLLSTAGFSTSVGSK